MLFRSKPKEPIPQASGKCYNCGKKGHFKSECRAKAKSLINTLVSDQPSKNEIFKLLELDRSDSESYSSASDSELKQIYRSSSSPSSTRWRWGLIILLIDNRTFFCCIARCAKLGIGFNSLKLDT